ncbi:MAG: TIGR03619 family F420-dependent LLM class oxidoreductase [Nitrospinae bacterium]|nr:TIGR03619 family F420-dependent LLM class oxidoreductase [Nitrospinota bacterium]
MNEAVKYGYGYGMQPGDVPTHSDFLGFIEKVEGAGFDSFWMDDHIAFRGNFLESLAALAAAAARTERIVLGSLVYLLPLRRPAIAAKAAATVDYLSGGGRFIFGVGVGGEEEKEFEVCGVPKTERGARTDEAIEVLRKLWSGEAVSHEGRYFRFSDARQSPPPASPGGPPIWVGGRSEAAQRRAALLADGYAPYLYSPSRYEKALSQIHRFAAEVERALDDPQRPWTPALHLFVNLSEKEDEALDEGARNLSMRYGMDMREAANRYLLHGSVARCAERIDAYRKAGVRHFIFKAVASAGEEAEHMMQLAQELLPEVKRHAD